MANRKPHFSHRSHPKKRPTRTFKRSTSSDPRRSPPASPLNSLRSRFLSRVQLSASTFLKSLKFSFPKPSLLFLCSFALLFFCLIFYWFILRDLPSPGKLATNPYPVSTLIYDRHGSLLYEIYADQNRIPVSLHELPDYVVNATIAIEDKDFYKHVGLSPSGILRAVVRNFQYLFCQLSVVSCPSSFQGGSTITQQLVKNALLSQERTLQRKLKEAILTIVVETRYTKQQILEMYLNQVPYGGTAYGIEAAAKTYFNKSAQDLTISEATILAGLPVAPSRYSPFGSQPDAYKDRQTAVVRRMVEDAYLTDQQAQEALDTPVTFAEPVNLIHAPHFVLWIKDLLIEKYGHYQVEQGGLRVTTTLDLNIQQASQQIIDNEIVKLTNYKATNAAALVTHPPTGQILAMIGSADYFNRETDGNVNLTLRYRQPGSSIKPLNYTLGFTNGNLTPSSLLADIPTCFSVTGQSLYCPQNYDGTYHGPVQARYALANSYNIPAVRTLAKNSINDFVDVSTQMGIAGWDDLSRFGLSLTLGGGEVRMLDMATAYGTLANLGTRVAPNPILKVTTHTGDLLEQAKCETLTNNKQLTTDNNLTVEQFNNNSSSSTLSPNPYTLSEWDSLGTPTYCNGTNVIPPAAAYLTTNILSDNNARSAAFGTDSQLQIPNQPYVAVKTGTTNDLRDNWTIGYTPDRLTAVWVGNFDNSPMARIASGVTGAAPIWHQIMNYLLNANQPKMTNNDNLMTTNYQSPLPPKPFPRPSDVIDLAVCTEDGLAVSPDPTVPCTSRTELFIQDYLPQHHTNPRRPWPIDKTTGRPAIDRTPPENVELRDQTIYFDILGTAICTDCTPPEDPVIIKYPLNE